MHLPVRHTHTVVFHKYTMTSKRSGKHYLRICEPKELPAWMGTGRSLMPEARGWGGTALPMKRSNKATSVYDLLKVVFLGWQGKRDSSMTRTWP